MKSTDAGARKKNQQFGEILPIPCRVTQEFSVPSQNETKSAGLVSQTSSFRQRSRAYFEALLFTLTTTTLRLADRIEKAYMLRQSEWRGVRVDPRVWGTAASSLVGAHRKDEWLPLDPELFVASQPRDDGGSDPWELLTSSIAIRHYRAHVLRIIRGLRRELRSEFRKVERRMVRGESVDQILAEDCRSLSALGRMIAAHRAGRPDLVDKARPAARDQHWACPLYRVACEGLLPAHAYPVIEVLPGWNDRNRPPCKRASLSMN